MFDGSLFFLYFFISLYLSQKYDYLNYLNSHKIT
ncbi:unnamed protein product [Spirodela intermedia]|uniref:Uncharacterized protein n=1 Tax=Spirodela intermedia TaxID=51605 RepID=A0A7I8JI40_SPIIN|nr:unnamed protein product [Spirodela intermedia]CAA6669829.1 unnamed protein product [Spirodela intermedia]